MCVWTLGKHTGTFGPACYFQGSEASRREGGQGRAQRLLGSLVMLPDVQKTACPPDGPGSEKQPARLSAHLLSRSGGGGRGETRKQNRSHHVISRSHTRMLSCPPVVGFRLICIVFRLFISRNVNGLL